MGVPRHSGDSRGRLSTGKNWMTKSALRRDSHRLVGYRASHCLGARRAARSSANACIAEFTSRPRCTLSLPSIPVVPERRCSLTRSRMDGWQCSHSRTGAWCPSLYSFWTRVRPKQLRLRLGGARDFFSLTIQGVRRVARRLGIPVAGVAGVLLVAKSRGTLAAIAPVLEELSCRRIPPVFTTRRRCACQSG